MTFALWFLAAFGAAFVLGHSKISLVFREMFAGSEGEENGVLWKTPPLIPFFGPWLAALLECPGCLGWWFGFVAGASGFVELSMPMPYWGAGLFLAFATSGANILLAKWVGLT